MQVDYEEVRYKGKVGEMKFWVCKGTAEEDRGWRKSDDRQRKGMELGTKTSSKIRNKAEMKTEI